MSDIFRFCQILSNIVQYCQILSNIVKFCSRGYFSSLFLSCIMIWGMIIYLLVLLRTSWYCQALQNTVQYWPILSSVPLVEILPLCPSCVFVTNFSAKLEYNNEYYLKNEGYLKNKDDCMILAICRSLFITCLLLATCYLFILAIQVFLNLAISCKKIASFRSCSATRSCC